MMGEITSSGMRPLLNTFNFCLPTIHNYRRMLLVNLVVGALLLVTCWASDNEPLYGDEAPQLPPEFRMGVQ